MFCQKCGKKLFENAKFCDNCGCRIDNPAIDNNDHHQTYAEVQPIKYQYQMKPVIQISKKDYFASVCSPKAKKLKTASWIIWIISIVLSIINMLYMLFGGNFLKSETGSVTFEGEKIQEGTTNFYTLNDIFEMPKTLSILVVVLIVIMVVSIIVTVLLGFLACSRKSVGLSVAFVIVALISGWIGKIFDLPASICILVFNVKLEREYKQYICGNVN